LHKLVNPETGERKGQIKGIMKPKKYPVYPDPEDFPRRYFVSDPDLYKRSVHSTRDSTVKRFRFVKDGTPVHKHNKYFYKSKKGGKNRSHTKKSGRKTGRKTYKRRH